mgnify:CR=1 FL=1
MYTKKVEKFISANNVTNAEKYLVKLDKYDKEKAKTLRFKLYTQAIKDASQKNDGEAVIKYTAILKIIIGGVLPKELSLEESRSVIKLYKKRKYIDRSENKKILKAKNNIVKIINQANGNEQYYEETLELIDTAEEMLGRAKVVNFNELAIPNRDGGIVWQKVAYDNNGRGLSFNQAKRYCKNLTLSGFSDWELSDGGSLESAIQGIAGMLFKYKPNHNVSFWAEGRNGEKPGEPYTYNFITRSLVKGANTVGAARCAEK